MAIPDQCINTQGDFLNSSPALSSFPCDVLKALGLPNVDPNFQTPRPFDYSNYTNHLESLSAVGDPRWSVGAMFTDLLDNVMPQVVLQTEMLQAGGCQIIDQFICDSNGKPLKVTSNTCNISGKDIVNITPDYIRNYINNKLDQAKTAAADRFIDFLQKNFKDQGWNISIAFYQSTYNLFYIGLNKPGASDTYFKYYADQREYISLRLKLPITPILEISNAAGTYSPAVKKALTDPIPNY